MATLTTSWQKLGEKYLGASGGSLYVRIYARYSSQDIANNRTYVYYQSRAYYSGGYIIDAQSTGNVSGTGLSTKSSDVPDRLNGGETTIATTEGWVYHNSDGKKSISASGYLKYPNWGWSATASGSANLPKIPRQANITGADNFNDEGNPKITYSNPAGNSVSSLQACIASSDGNTMYANYRDISKTGSSYTFNLTNAERGTLRNATPNSNSLSVKFYVRTVISGTYYYSTSSKTMTIVNGNPIFANFEWQTTNYSNLTGNDTTVIKGYSNVKTIVSEENKATAVKEATLINYQTTIGSKSTTNNKLTYPVENTVKKVDGASITMFANDSRGNSKSITKPIANYIEYQKISGSITNLARTQEVNSEVNLQFEGEIDIINFGAVENNIKSCKYYYKETNSQNDFIEGATSLNVTLTQIEGTKYKYEVNQNIAGDLGASGFDINNSYLIKVVVNDEIDFAEDTETLGNGSPAIAVKSNCVSLGSPYNEELGGRVQINGEVYTKPNKDYIQLVLSGEFTTTAKQYTKIPFQWNWSEIKEHNSFSFDENGSITIQNPNVKRISVNVSALNASWESKNCYITVNRNETTLKNCYVKAQSYIQTQIEMKVSQGDVITATYYCEEAVRISSNRAYTHMTVSVL